MRTELLAWLIDATIATSIACVAVLLLRKPTQRWLGAEIAYRLWIVLPLASLAALFSLPRAAPVESVAVQVPIAPTPAAVVVRVATSLRSIDADRWLLAIWLLGACALLGVLIWQQRRFVTRLRLRENGDGSWRSSIEGVVPGVLGVLRQRLVLPERFETDYSDEEQRLVIAHERMHQRRRDPWALVVCAALRMLFWFNPIVHVAVGRFRRDLEMACDAAVLRTHPRSRRRYASALLKTHFADGALPIGCQWHQTPPMKERIMLLKHALPTRYTRLAGAILLSMAALGTTGIAMAGHEAALNAASTLATAAPAEVAPAPPAPPAPPTIADVDTPPAPPAPPKIANVPTPPVPPAPPKIANVPAPPAPPAPPVRPVHARHARLASASAPPVRAQPAAPAVVPIPLVASVLSMPAPTLAPVGPDPTPGNDGRYTMDMDYIAAVNSAASDQGVRVIWVNPPEKRKHD